MTTELEIGLYIFMLAGFLGYHLIRGVPPLLHTPLMSATNAMSGISLVGSLLVAGSGHSRLSTAFGFIAVTCSATNVVGGFLITDRMLKMFKSERDRTVPGRWYQLSRPAMVALGLLVVGLAATLYWLEELRTVPAKEVLRYLYILSGVLFVLGLKGLSSPKWARKGMFLAEFGMLVAIVGTLFHDDIHDYTWITIGLVIGSVVGGS